MGRIATKDFQLNLPGVLNDDGTVKDAGGPVFYKAGQKIEKEHADHWYAIEHSSDPKEAEEAAKQSLIDQANAAQAAAEAAQQAADDAAKAAKDAQAAAGVKTEAKK